MSWMRTLLSASFSWSRCSHPPGQRGHSPASATHGGKGSSMFWRWRVKNRLIQNLLSDGVLVVQRLQCQKFIQWHYVTYMWKWIHDQIAQFWHRGRHFMWHFVLLQHDTCCHLTKKYCCLFHLPPWFPYAYQGMGSQNIVVGAKSSMQSMLGDGALFVPDPLRH